MGVKEKRKILVKFHGEKEVEAYSLDDARAQVEGMKNINPEKGITTMGYLEVIQEGITLNIPAMFSTVVSIFYLGFLFTIYTYISNIESSEIQFVGLICWLILFCVTIRFPVTVGRYFKRSRYD